MWLSGGHYSTGDHVIAGFMSQAITLSGLYSKRDQGQVITALSGLYSKRDQGQTFSSVPSGDNQRGTLIEDSESQPGVESGAYEPPTLTDSTDHHKYSTSGIYVPYEFDTSKTGIVSVSGVQDHESLHKTESVLSPMDLSGTHLKQPQALTITTLSGGVLLTGEGVMRDDGFSTVGALSGEDKYSPFIDTSFSTASAVSGIYDAGEHTLRDIFRMSVPGLTGEEMKPGTQIDDARATVSTLSGIHEPSQFIEYTQQTVSTLSGIHEPSQFIEDTQQTIATLSGIYDPGQFISTINYFGGLLSGAGNYSQFINTLDKVHILSGGNYALGLNIETVGIASSLSGSQDAGQTYESSSIVYGLTGGKYSTGEFIGDGTSETMASGGHPLLVVDSADITAVTEGERIPGTVVDYGKNVLSVSGPEIPGIVIDNSTNTYSISGNFSKFQQTGVYTCNLSGYNTTQHPDAINPVNLSGRIVSTTDLTTISTYGPPPPARKITTLDVVTFDEDQPAGIPCQAPILMEKLWRSWDNTQYSWDFTGSLTDYIQKYTGGGHAGLTIQQRSQGPLGTDNMTMMSEAVLCFSLHTSEHLRLVNRNCPEIWSDAEEKYIYDCSFPNATGGGINILSGYDPLGGRALPFTNIAISTLNTPEEEHDEAIWTADQVTLPWPFYTLSLSAGQWWMPHPATVDSDVLRADLVGPLLASDKLTTPRLY
jgi:hypothetical protein